MVVARIVIFLHIPYRCKIEQPDTRQCNGIKKFEMKCACGSSFIKIIWKMLSLKISIYYIKRLGHQAVFSAEIVREQRDTEAENY